MKTFLILAVVLSNIMCTTGGQEPRKITKNGMTVSWYLDGKEIHFEMYAPTKGWVTLGVNESSGTKNAYLLMGHIVKGEAYVVEHFAQSPGNYTPIQDLGGPVRVRNVSGKEMNGKTSLKFSLPIGKATEYQKELIEGKKYHMILAYSVDDDFQHHSIMRTSVEIQL